MLVSPITDRSRQLGLSPGELAVLVDVSRSLIAIWTRSEALPKGEGLMKLARALHRDERELATKLTEYQKAVRSHLQQRTTNTAAVMA